MLSDEARLLWPFFWCASNTLGRLELNYRKFLGRAFHQFKTPPTEERFWGIVREYRDCYLLFVYRVDSTVWGQWDAPERLLSSKYKTAADRRTPAPDYKSFIEWKNTYLEAKLALQADNPNSCNLFEKVFDSLEKFQENSRFTPLGSGSGSGRDSDKEEQNPPTPLAGGLSDAPPSILKHRPAKRSIGTIETSLGVIRLPWWIEFWSIYPCREDKRAAMDAFERAVTCAEVWAKVRAGAIRYRQKADATPDLKLKYGQGWINGERWEDEGEARASPIKGGNDGAVRVLMRNLQIEEDLKKRLC